MRDAAVADAPPVCSASRMLLFHWITISPENMARSSSVSSSMDRRFVTLLVMASSLSSMDCKQLSDIAPGYVGPGRERWYSGFNDMADLALGLANQPLELRLH